ncbi:MAG: Smr/MutS family protein [Jejuia sp.]
MKFKVGDTVAVLDEDISGSIVKISNGEVVIETTDGFQLSFVPTELVHNSHSDDIIKSISSFSKNKDFLKSKVTKKNSTKKTKKERVRPVMEVDLHIHQLVNSSKGMTNYDMLNLQIDTAKRKLDFAIVKRIQRIVFIHGVGEGVLRMELETLFRRYDNIKYYDANYHKYGLGATEVYIYQNKI